jgi:phosphoribosyl-AMP cyclohydrolase
LSRSRQKDYVRGESTGNYWSIDGIFASPRKDSVLYEVTVCEKRDMASLNNYKIPFGAMSRSGNLQEGLVPVIVQDSKTNDILILAYANKMHCI